MRAGSRPAVDTESPTELSFGYSEAGPRRVDASSFSWQAMHRAADGFAARRA